MMGSWRKIKLFIAALGIVSNCSIIPILVAPSIALAQSERPTVQRVRRLLEVSDVLGQSKKVMPRINDAIWKSISKNNINIPDEERKEISNEMLAAMLELMPMMLESIIPIYRKYLTSEEVDAWIEFYETPSGQSIAKQSGNILIESYNVGARVGKVMGKKAAQTAIKRLREKGYKL